MSVSEDLINFDIIETQKENIQALPQGRSAKALASAFAPSPFSPLHTPGATRNLNDTFRAEYEAEIQTINDSDDPLDIYDRYVKWTFNAYPTAQATPESQLRSLLERATKAFQNTPTYKNDPRYLKLWIHYIRLFSDAPREVFAYLSRHGIGEGLALYYEEFAAWLEGAGRWSQAEEIYKLGIEREARPSERLLRKFGEFQKRYEARPADADEPSSPALQTVRPALAAKLDPYASSTTRTDDPQAQRLPVASNTSRSNKQKIAIFADADGSLAGKSESTESSKGWDSIGSIKERKKENMMDPKPWAGETLKSGKRVGTVSKMTVFRDQTASDINANLRESAELKSVSPLVTQQETTNPKTGKLERILANLSCIYPDSRSEFCFAEVMAQKRGWSSRDWSMKSRIQSMPIQNTPTTSDSVSEDQSRKIHGMTELDDSEEVTRDHNISDNTQEISQGEEVPKIRRKKTMEVKGETQTIKLNLASPSKAKKVRRKSTAEPTMTLHSRAATDEVLDMFNQTLRNVGSITEEPQAFNDSDYDDDDYTSGGESTCTGTGRLSGPLSEYGDETEALDRTSQSLNQEFTEQNSVGAWTEFTESKHIPKLADVETTQPEDPEDAPIKTPITAEVPESQRAPFFPSPPRDVRVPTHPYRDLEQSNQNRLPFMTPIVEMTESSISMPSSRRPGDYFTSKTPSRRRHEADSTIPELEDLLLDDTTEFQHLAKVEEETQENQLIDLEEPKRDIPLVAHSTQEEIDTIFSISEANIGTTGNTDNHVNTDNLSSALDQLSLLENSAQTIPSQASFEVIGRSDRDVVIFDDHVNPIAEDVRQRIIHALQPPLETYPGYYDHKPSSSQIKSELERIAKTGLKKSKNGGEKLCNLEVEPVLQISETQTYTVKQLLGRGGWATVYLAEETTSDGNVELQAMKSEFDPSAWEYFMMVLVQARLKQWSLPDLLRSIQSIARPLCFHSYADAGYMFESFHEQGTLLELVNKVKADALPAGTNAGAIAPGVDEHLAMFFAVEILRTVSDMHSVGILHCDIKADNFLVRLDTIDESEEAWATIYSPAGEHGWSSKGIVLIDFGRAIDTLAFKPDTCFYAEWATDKHDCPEQREARPWTYQADLWGVASIFSVLLFGKVLEETVVTEPSSVSTAANLPIGGSNTHNKRYKPRDTFKRYWQTDLWTDVFDVLMNPAQHATQSERVGRGSGGIKGLPATKLSSVRERMEQFLVENTEKKGLKQSLKKLEEKLNSSAHNLAKRR